MNNVELLIEIYTTLKEYIPTKDRQEAADNLISMLADVLSDIELSEFGATDKFTRSSMEEYASDLDIDDDQDYDE